MYSISGVIRSPLTPPISSTDRSSSLPHTSPHLVEALRAEFALLGTQVERSLSTRGRNDIIHSITTLSDLRAHLENPHRDLPELVPDPHATSSPHPLSFDKSVPISVDAPNTTVPHSPPSAPPGGHHRSRRNMAGSSSIPYTHAPDLAQSRADESAKPIWTVSFRPWGFLFFLFFLLCGVLVYRGRAFETSHMEGD